MKRMVLTGMAFVLACVAFAQPQDTLFARINAIKLNPDYLYGCCTMPDPEESVVEAMHDLSDRVERYLHANGFVYIRDISACPESVIQRITVRKEPDHFRTLAYVSKQLLAEMEQIEATAFEGSGKNALNELIRRLPDARTLSDLEELLSSANAEAYILSGPVTMETPQEYVDGGFLVFYDQSSGGILEIMSPRDSGGIRTNVRSGAVASPMAYRKVPAYWIYVEGQIMQVLK